MAKDIGDNVGEATARMNIMDLRNILGMPEISSPSVEINTIVNDDKQSVKSGGSNSSQTNSQSNSSSRQYRMRRQSMEQLNLIKV